jgi:hypothetical protein
MSVKNADKKGVCRYLHGEKGSKIFLLLSELSFARVTRHGRITKVVSRGLKTILKFVS